MTDHALMLASALGLRPPGNADLPFMIEAAAQSAWSTDRARRSCRRHRGAADSKDHSPGTGGHRAHRHCRTGAGPQAGRGCSAADLSPAQLAKLDALLILDPAFAATPLAWLRNAPTSPKPNHVRALLDRLQRVREIGVALEAAAPIHEDRLQRLVREGRVSDAHQMERYTVQRRRAILAASVIDLEARLTDAALEMADKLIGGMFRARERLMKALRRQDEKRRSPDAPVPRHDRSAR